MDYAASNFANFALALSLNAQVFSEAKVFRHYFAHRTRNTNDAVQAFAAAWGILGHHMPEELVVRGRPGTGVRFLDGWLADVENFFDLAA